MFKRVIALALILICWVNATIACDRSESSLQDGSASIAAQSQTSPAESGSGISSKVLGKDSHSQAPNDSDHEDGLFHQCHLGHCAFIPVTIRQDDHAETVSAFYRLTHSQQVVIHLLDPVRPPIA